MSTDTETTELVTIESPVSDDVIADVQSEVTAADAGPLPQTEDMALLYRVLRVRARLTAEAARIREMADQMARQLESRVAGIDYQYGRVLEQVVRDELARTRVKAKSIKTPFGTAGFRTSPAKIEVVDELLVRGAGFVRIVPEQREVDRAALAAYVKETGDVPNGAKVVDGHENFFLK